MNKLLCFVTALFTCLNCYAAIPYCPQRKPVTSQEDKLIQILVPDFAKKMGCNAGNNCLSKWYDDGSSTKFSIAWQEVCGPVIDGMYQLGDQGHGSTFICWKDKSLKNCCAPLGYERDPYIICE